MAGISALENLPEIDVLKDEGITFDSIVNEMIADYEARYIELTGEELTIYPADSRRILINVTAGKIYQLATIINERHKLNFLQYMYGDFLKNWASNFGFDKDGRESASVKLRFHLADAQKTDIVIPKGTRATSGNGIFFATDEDTIIAAGEEYTDTNATCTEKGTIGNNYAIGQINSIADPVNLIESVENTTESSGGHDEYTDSELRELIYNFPERYSTAGSEGAYKELAMAYSTNIVDAKIITNNEAVVQIYILLQNGKVPDEEYCKKVQTFIYDLKESPDTDKIEVRAPEINEYEINATYYIPEEKKEIADGIKEAIMDAVEEFAEYTKTKVGRSINPGILTAYANAAGASRIQISSPDFQKIGESEVAVCRQINVIFGGFDKE